MEPKKNDSLNPVWVRLHLERQSSSSFMPPYIDGLLTKETPTAYVLGKVIKIEENEDTMEVEYAEVTEVHFVSRTYVWDCQILGERPITGEYNGEGGLG